MRILYSLIFGLAVLVFPLTSHAQGGPQYYMVENGQQAGP